MRHFLYRFKYRFGQNLPLTAPVDISLELSSFCSMHCSYCLDPSTPVLTADYQWIPIGNLIAGQKIIAFDENALGNKTNRKMRITEIEKIWQTKKTALKIITDQSEIICSGDHKFLDVGGRWRDARFFRRHDKIKFAAPVWNDIDIFDLDYMRGYICGMTDGDGTARWKPIEGSTGKENDPRRQVWWRIAITDIEPLERLIKYLEKIDISHNGIGSFPKTLDHYKDVFKIEIRKQQSLDRLHSFVFSEKINNNENYMLGYLAGIFDAEGSFATQGQTRISQKQSNHVIETSLKYLNYFGFDAAKESSGLRLLGGNWESLRFFGMIQPAIQGKLSKWAGKSILHQSHKILNIENLGERDLIDIQTGSATFYAAGFPTHNCYHADKKNLPFKQRFMDYAVAEKIIREGANLGVNSIKMNWRGESTMNPAFEKITRLAKHLATGSTYLERLSNSNFKFDSNREDIFEGLANQTKVKISYDSFRADVFEAQRTGGDHKLTTENIDKFYNWPGRTTDIVIQAVRTQANKDEDIEGQAKKRWPSASISIRDVVGGRKKDDIAEMIVNDRDASERQSCLQAHVRLIFDHQGRAMPCCPDIKNELVLGDINKQSMEDIFNGAKAKRLRKMLKDKTAFDALPVCKNCSSLETFKGFKPNWNS